ncbi:MAG TPA: hypothetical protein PLU24_02300, partial [Candidatus Omnitrophota bacterium]|nr:hypothetical protein [Candidatus Omnitrophota bacterium]
MNKRFILILGLALCSGCCTVDRSKEMEILRKDIRDLHKMLDSSESENLSLKEELVLFRKNQDIDTQKFISSQIIFSRELAPDRENDDISVD